ncbi:ArsR family transcriptional regulator [Croceicoccus estronivorus]|uniref:arsenate reductase ArsC n=1 Tax=Croceicoccus estronivorus TaxID=1172626 RepID=UPI00082BD81D|nr:arsenate reductase ArsC [Croceicoccus estronivorus]OCC22465.1 ArsR family transcriptional regulator [Croceicoccus estronivorus]
MTDKIYNVLFLCTGNSARSIMGEALMNKLGQGRFRGFSAGSRPKGEVHPMALDVLRGMGFAIEGLRSKSWDEFAGPDAPHMDFVFTVCGNAAGETCPVWPGHPVTAHWGIDDPAAVEGPGQHDAFLQALRYLRRRIELFLELPVASIDALSLRTRVQAIGDELSRREGAA